MLLYAIRTTLVRLIVGGGGGDKSCENHTLSILDSEFCNFQVGNIEVNFLDGVYNFTDVVVGIWFYYGKGLSFGNLQLALSVDVSIF